MLPSRPWDLLERRAMKVSEVMSSGVEFVDGGALVKDAAELMGELDVGSLPVGTQDALEGVVTDRDILYRVVARGLDPASVTVRDVMTAPVVGADVDDSVQSVLDAMAAHHVRRMPVRDARNRVVGWVTLGDLARKLLIEGQALQGFMHELTEKA